MKRAFRVTAASCLILAASAAMADGTKVAVGHTAIADYASVFLAKDQGIFEKEGLDVTPVMIPLNPNIPGAILGGSLQIGGVTPPVLFQADDNGLDLVVLAGGGVTDPGTKSVGLVGLKNTAIKRAEDLVGKKVGVPGIGSMLDVTLREWLQTKGVDTSKITFIEVALPAMADTLKSHSIDAAVVVGPFFSRFMGSGEGELIAPYLAQLPPRMPTILYVSTRAWAKANPEAVAKFKRSIIAANAFAKDHPDIERATIGKYLKLPPAFVSKIELPVLQYEVTKAGVDYWNDVLRKQNITQNAIQYETLVVK